MIFAPRPPARPGSLHLVEEGRCRPQEEERGGQRENGRSPEKTVEGERREGAMGECLIDIRNLH